MAQPLDSTAVFQQRALAAGLDQDAIQALGTHGVDTYSKLAYAVTTPGTTPSEEGLRLLLNRAHPEAVTVGALSSIRRLMFEGQTMVIAQIKRSVEGTESAKTAELAPAERESRIQAQKLRLVGLELSGHLECSHQSYDYVHRMLVLDAVSYLEPHRFTTRMSEVQHDRPPKELVIDHQQLTIRDSERKDRCTIQDLFSLSQALTRRALACDLMGACTFRHMDGWHRFLLEQCQLPAPPHFEAPSMAQILRADRAAWVKLAETLPSLKPAADGSLPLDAALQALRRDHTITFYLLPLPAHGGARRASLPSRDDDTFNKRKRKKQPRTPPPPRSQPAAPPSKGAGKSAGKTPSRMPSEFQGKQLHHNLPGGGRLCWNYNLKKGCTFAKPGDKCARGQHQCLKCLGNHALHECPTE